MSYWDKFGASDEWYTPKYIFDALAETYDLDPAHPDDFATHVPCGERFYTRGLERDWHGFVWMNPPFGGRNGIVPWLEKFVIHGNGVALTPDRSSTDWWHYAVRNTDAVLFLLGKVKFERPDGSVGKSPSNGTTLFASGARGVEALRRAERSGLGYLAVNGAAVLKAEAA